jgi:1-deoxy-D-xylulose-5-phosphate reductoisomerase
LKGITILGATGSIGQSTLDVVARHPDRYRAVALTANRQVEGLYELCMAHRPDYAVMVEESAAEQLEARLQAAGSPVRVLAGAAALETVAELPQADYVMAAIVGAAGLLPALAAARAGKRVLLANKEALVMSGALFMEAVRHSGAELLPIDSEHNAVFQCLPESFRVGMRDVGVRRILLTASGGPFRTRSRETLGDVTPEEACAHPNWVMGRKISVDSATLMNKGLEVIEACWLFDADADSVGVVIHPQSVMHSMVEYVDGSVLAQLGNPDMRIPIAYALAWPQRLDAGAARLSLVDVARLDFEDVDNQRFPSLSLAYQAMRAGGTATAILNAANEIAVQAFLEEHLAFTDIPVVVESTLADVSMGPAASIEAVLAADALARDSARAAVRRCGGR